MILKEEDAVNIVCTRTSIVEEADNEKPKDPLLEDEAGRTRRFRTYIHTHVKNKYLM